ncbi:hypothetical protein OG352_06560 [Streptomyces sp. NBC_01485]|uniref:hypothetical protein n=1 Tax=Streptomyces sp. NBC_01485 TaxID=2903884 RepID=UPI002E2F7E16|nr:hypothetical protein [Streptomyces sp. NBC_01485]
MSGTDDYGQGITVAALTDAPNAETLAKNIANGIAQRSVMRFASASARSAALTGATAPVEGMVSWLQDVNGLYFYDGSAWQLMNIVETMAWTNLSSIGSYAGGFSASTPAPRMRKLSMLGTEVWEYEGAIAISSLPAATTTTAFTFNSGYRPASGRGFATYNSSHYATRVTVGTNGVLAFSVPTEAGSGVSKVWLDEMRITNPAD